MPFEKGRSGNPQGRAIDKPWREALHKALAVRKEKKGPQNLERVALACVNAALGGDVGAIKEIGDRIDGKVPQAQVIQGDKENPVYVVTLKPRTYA